MLAPFIDALTAETDPEKQNFEWVAAGLDEIASRCDLRDSEWQLRGGASCGRAVAGLNACVPLVVYGGSESPRNHRQVRAYDLGHERIALDWPQRNVRTPGAARSYLPVPQW